MKIKLTQLDLKAHTQSRHGTNNFIVNQYAEAISEGAFFPPIRVLYDPNCALYIIHDGHHTVGAHQKLGLKDIEADVTGEGNEQDALWLAFTANLTHGLPRTVDDKAFVVEQALLHPNSAKMSSRELARHIGVSHTYVDNIKNRKLEIQRNDPELETAMEIIGDRFPKQADAIQDGSLQMKRADLIEFATRPEEEQKLLAPHVFDRRLSLSKADGLVNYRPASEELPLKDFINDAMRHDGFAEHYFRGHSVHVTITGLAEENTP